MSEGTTQDTVVSTPKKKAAKKSSKGKGKTAKKTVKKGTKKTAPAGRVKKSGLRKPQIRILQMLAKKPNNAFSRKQIAEKAPADLAMLNSYIGSHDETIRAKNDAKVMPSLLTLKYLKYASAEDESKYAYQITAAGKAALQKALALA